MSRRAILIAAADAIPERCIPGATKDIEDFHEYLRSPLGGAWIPNHEIWTFYDRDDLAVLGAIAATTDVDYTMVVFSGHGGHTDPNDLTTSTVRFTEKTYPVSQLIPHSKKYTVIADSCRYYAEKKPLIAEHLKYHVKIASSQSTTENFRDVYQEILRRTPVGGNVVFACDVGELAGVDDAIGSYFIQTLIAQAKDWDAMHVGQNSDQKMNVAVVEVNRRLKGFCNQTAKFHPDTADAGIFPFALHLD